MLWFLERMDIWLLFVLFWLFVCCCSFSSSFCLFVLLLFLWFCLIVVVVFFFCLFVCFFRLFCFVEILDAKLNPMLAYTSEIWETVSLDNIEKVPMMPCMRFFGVPLGTANKMVYDELGRCSIFVPSILRCLKHCVF